MFDSPQKMIDWEELFPWLIFKSSLRLAIMVRVIFLSAVAMVLLVGGWKILGSTLTVESTDSVVQSWNMTGCQWGFWWQDNGPSPSARLHSIQNLFYNTAHNTNEAPAVGPTSVSFPFWLKPIQPVLLLFNPAITFRGILQMLPSCLWMLAVWSLLGGAISRIAALYLTRGETVSTYAAFRFAEKRFFSFAIGPLLVLGALLLLVIPMVLAGFLMSWTGSWIAILIGWPVVLILGLMFTLLAAGMLIGWPLLWATIAVELSDPFDAVSRTYAYVFQRPLHLAWYAFLGYLLNGAILIVSTTCIYYTSDIVLWAMNLGGYTETQQILPAASLVSSEYPAATPLIVQISNNGIRYFFSSIQIGFMWSAFVAGYLLLRRDIDATEMDEIVVDEPILAGVTPMDADHSGLPKVSEKSSESVSEDSPKKT